MIALNPMLMQQMFTIKIKEKRKEERDVIYSI